MSSDRVIEGQGTAGSTWVQWLATKASAHRPLDGWLGAAQRLVVLAPHPDDEVLACGGLVSLHLLRGGEVLIVAVSDGEASHDGVAGWSPWRLADVRRMESATGLKRLAPVPAQVLRLGLPDGDIRGHVDDLTGILLGILQPSDVVVTTWRLDGHPDHESVGMAAAHVCDAAGCRLLEAPVWMWHWALPDDSRIPWHRLASLTLDAETLARKDRALAAHTSQLRARDQRLGPVLGPGIRARAAWPVEYFFC